MLFNSGIFIVFLCIVVVLYYSLPHRYRWMLLLLASYVFYMTWQPAYSLLIAFTTIVSYWIGNKVAKNRVKAKLLMRIGVLVNILVLFFFKYFNFLNDALRDLLGLVHVDYSFSGLNILLPVAISFYTFQTLSYILDIYYGKIEPCNHLGKFALYISFFPQLVAGPIERSSNLLPQLEKKIKLIPDNIFIGVKRVVWGLFKKVVIADRLAILVDTAFDNAADQSGLVLILAIFLFAFQLYCDFSAYSDIAIGSAKLVGITLMENFNLPFISKNITEFWRRWHISLSTWLRDYLYTPIMFKRKKWGKKAIIYSLFITFFICGLWHGPKWTYVVFGVLQGIALTGELLLAKQRKKWSTIIPKRLYSYSSMILTFLFMLVCFMFFRADSMSHSFTILSGIFDIGTVGSIAKFVQPFGLSRVMITILLLVSFILFDKGLSIVSNTSEHKKWHLPLYSLLACCLLIFGNWGNVAFVYFQF